MDHGNLYILGTSIQCDTECIPTEAVHVVAKHWYSFLEVWSLHSRRSRIISEDDLMTLILLHFEYCDVL